eukprot:751893-Hanusia_phi.AAC.1
MRVAVGGRESRLSKRLVGSKQHLQRVLLTGAKERRRKIRSDQQRAGSERLAANLFISECVEEGECYNTDETNQFTETLTTWTTRFPCRAVSKR